MTTSPVWSETVMSLPLTVVASPNSVETNEFAPACRTRPAKPPVSVDFAAARPSAKNATCGSLVPAAARITPRSPKPGAPAGRSAACSPSFAAHTASTRPPGPTATSGAWPEPIGTGGPNVALPAGLTAARTVVPSDHTAAAVPSAPASVCIVSALSGAEIGTAGPGTHPAA